MFQSTFQRVVRTVAVFAMAAGVAHTAARADDFYSYSFSGTGVSGAGTVGLVSTSTSGVYQVTYIDGQVNGTTINGLLQPGTYKGNDNLFYQGTSYVDASGVSFDLADSSSTQLNIYYDGSDYYFQGDGTFQLDGGSGPGVNRFSRFATFSTASSDVNVKLDQFSFAPQAETATTPEPSSLMLLGTGALATAGMLRRRFSRA